MEWFNAAIKAYCYEHDTPYLNLDPECLGDNGLVMPSLLNRNECDHHYAPKKHIQLIVPKLRTIFRGLGQ